MAAFALALVLLYLLSCSRTATTGRPGAGRGHHDGEHAIALLTLFGIDRGRWPCTFEATLLFAMVGFISTRAPMRNSSCAASIIE
jgi:hypothetical protein